MARRPVSMRDIAERVGVSRNAVSLALRNDPQISAATRERIIRTAREMGYARNPVVGEIMARMRSGGTGGCRMTLALVNANVEPDAFKTHPTIPNYVAGCQRRAKALGYGLDRFWLYEPGMSGERWSGVFEARGIQGVLLVGMMKQNRVPDFFHPVLERLPCVVTGARTRGPALPFACVDHHMLALRAFEKALELGYQRPGLVLDQVIDDLVDGRFTSGYRTGQQQLPRTRQLKPFLSVQAAREKPGLFEKWIAREKPDVVFTLYNEVRRWIEALGLKIPGDIGLIQLERRANHSDWAGMDQHNDLTGEAALDMLVSMIHNGERSVPAFPRATMIGSTWVHGTTVRGTPP